jgi:signal transduction histidine kinase
MTASHTNSFVNLLPRNPFLRYGVLLGAAAVGLAFVSPGFMRGLLRADQFMPHASCYLRNPRIIALHVTSDLLIGFAYVAISSTLAWLVCKSRQEIPFHWMFLAFGLFIITCGFTHFMEVWTVWQAVYWLAGWVKVICAVASVATAIALCRLVPRIFALINAIKISEERKLKLQTANSELEAFAYTVSHDLRAPLRAVQGMALALTEDFGPKLEPGAREYLDQITGASQRMDGLIRDLLEYSRVSRVEFKLNAVDLDTVLADAQAAVAADAQQSSADVQIEGVSSSVVANSILLTQVMANLLSNAIKFVGPGVRPIVRVQLQDKGHHLRICVKDNGIGIPPEYQHRIFQIFERLHSPTEYPGTGIGLAIVKKAVARMKGELGMESVPGEGSCFWVELPKGE